MNNRRMIISKQMARAIQKAEAEIIREGDRQLDIQVCAAMLALSRFWNWKKEELVKLADIHREIWNEVGSDNDISMLQLLDEECDIELTNMEGVSYKEFKFLNTAIDDGSELTPQQWLVMRMHQKEWLECQIMACIFLGMYRKEGWSAKRVKELMDRMQEIKSDFDYKEKELIKAVNEECRFDWLDYRGKYES